MGILRKGRQPRARWLPALWVRRMACALLTAVVVALAPASALAGELVFDGSAHAVNASDSLDLLIVNGPDRPLENVLLNLDAFEPLAAKGTTRPPSLGDETYWLHGVLRNATDAPQRLYLVHQFGITDRVNFYRRTPQGWTVTKSGDHVPVGDREVYGPLPTGALDLNPGETQEFAIELRTVSAVLLKFKVVDAIGLTEAVITHSGGVFVLCGFLLALALYNLSLFRGTRDMLFLFYSGSVIFQALTWFTTSGVQSMLGAGSVTLVDGGVNAFPFISLALAIAFGRRYAEVQVHAPRIDGALHVAQWLFVAWGAVVPFFFRRADVIGSAPMLAVLLTSLTLAIAYISFGGGGFYARNYLFGTSMLLAGSVLYILTVRGVLPEFPLVLQAPYIGSALDALILSAGLAERVRRLSEEAAESRELALSAARSRLEAQEKVTKEIQRLDQLKDLFLATTSHELRTPINGMVGLADALLDGYAGPLAARAEKNLRIIVESGRRLAGLVNDILDYTRLRHAELVMEKRKTSLTKVVDAVLDLQRPEALRKGLSLTHDVEGSIVVFADDGRLQQILHNLVGNAIKFTADGSVSVHARVEGLRTVVEVSDTGPGVPEAARLGIFDPFDQGNADSKVARRGAGLGLAIARQLAEAHGGRMEYATGAEVGSVFRFDLETSQHIASTPGVVGSIPPSSAPIPASLPFVPRVADPRRETILIVDDDEVNRHVLVQQLSRAGLAVDECEGGAQAVDRILSENCPALVLLDVMMPDLSGFDVLDRVRPHRNSTDLPIVLLTALTRESDIIDGFRHGANDYLTKPFTREELLVRIGHHLSLRRFSVETIEARRRLERELEERARLEGTVEELRVRQVRAEGDLEVVLVAKQAVEVERTEAQRQLIQAEKMASLGQMVASVAHEIDNPLNYVGGAVAICQRRLGAIRVALGEPSAAPCSAAIATPMNDIDRFLVIIDDGVRRLSEITRAMRNYGRMDDERTDHVDLTSVIREALVIVGARTRPFDLRTEFGDVPSMSCHRSHIGQVVLNLVVNAADALGTRDRGDSHNQGIICLRTGLTDDGASVRIVVEDDGPGVPDDKVAAIMRPFFTTKPAGKGTGLGLAICTRIAEEHGGTLTLDRSPEFGGARFTLTVPRNLTPTALA